jgi:hypothetical protein
MSKFTFKPTKRIANDGLESECTNADRAERGEAMFRIHPDNEGMNVAADDKEAGAKDALADYFHFLDSINLDVEAIIRGAKIHWEAER